MIKILGGIKKTLLLLFSIAFLFPLFIAINNAFKEYSDIVKSPLSLPIKFTLENFKLAFERSHIGELYLNSIIITTVSVAILIAISSMSAYVIARRKHAFYKLLYIFYLCGIMVPSQVVLIPSIKTLSAFHLLGKFSGLYMFYAGTYISLGLFLYVEFIKTIPVSLEEAAVIDGANSYQIFFKIIFPLLKPCTATVLIFLGTWIWNDFLNPMVILGSNRGRTITTGIYAAIGVHTTEWNIVFACVIFASLPVVMLYLLLQKQFMKGLTAGAIKG